MFPVELSIVTISFIFWFFRVYYSYSFINGRSRSNYTCNHCYTYNNIIVLNKYVSRNHHYTLGFRKISAIKVIIVYVTCVYTPSNVEMLTL